MDFGVILPSYGMDANRMANIDTAHAAADLGYNSIWVTDHLALPEEDADQFGRIFESMSMVSYLAGVTTRIKIGISALVLPQRNPVEVAKMLATADLLSSGRIILSAGVGWSSGEYYNLGEIFKNRGKRMDEALKVLRLLWSGREVVSFTGNFYQFENLTISPQPLQRMGPPIWIAGNSLPAVHRAATMGDGWHPTLKPIEMFISSMKVIRSLVGRRPFEVCMRLPIPIPDAFCENYPYRDPFEAVCALLKDYQAEGLTSAIFDFSAKNQTDREQKMKLFLAAAGEYLV